MRHENEIRPAKQGVIYGPVKYSYWHYNGIALHVPSTITENEWHMLREVIEIMKNPPTKPRTNTRAHP